LHTASVPASHAAQLKACAPTTHPPLPAPAWRSNVLYDNNRGITETNKTKRTIIKRKTVKENIVKK
jgi:hypothetical protein